MITLDKRVERLEDILLSLLIIAEAREMVPDPPSTESLDEWSLEAKSVMHIMMELNLLIEERREAQRAESSASQREAN